MDRPHCVRLSRTLLLNDYYESVFTALNLKARMEIVEILANWDLAIKKKSLHSLGSAHHAIQITVNNPTADLIGRFRQETHDSVAHLRRALGRMKALKESEVEVIKNMLDVRQAEVNYERGELGMSTCLCFDL